MRKNNKFMLYYMSVVISNFGNACTAFVLPLYILDLTKSVLHLSIISAFQLIPFLILGLPFGAIVDRVNIKKLMQICDMIRFFNYVALAIVLLIENVILSIGMIYVCSVISGICYVFHSISETTFIPYVVYKNGLATANSLVYGIQYVTNFIVPIIGGIIYRISNVSYFFLFDAFTYLFSFIILSVLQVDNANNLESIKKMNFKQIFSDVKEGFVFLKSDTFLCKLLIVVSFSNLIIAPYYNCLLDYEKFSLSFDSNTIGIIEGIFSLGALVGSLIVEYLVVRFKKVNIILWCIGVDAFCRIALPHNNTAQYICLLMVIIELTSAILNIMIITIRQENVDKQYLGRLNSVFKTVLLGINPVGLLLGGIIIERIGAYNNLILISILCLILFVFAIFLFKTNKTD